MDKISGVCPRQEVFSFMTKIDIFSGFLGAGKTTLIKKLIAEAYTGEKIVLIENEFGEIAIDGGFLKDSGVQINEMNSGCICCSLVGDFADALQKVLEQFHPRPHPHRALRASASSATSSARCRACSPTSWCSTASRPSWTRTSARCI